MWHHFHFNSFTSQWVPAMILLSACDSQCHPVSGFAVLTAPCTKMRLRQQNRRAKTVAFPASTETVTRQPQDQDDMHDSSGTLLNPRTVHPSRLKPDQHLQHPSTTIPSASTEMPSASQESVLLPPPAPSATFPHPAHMPDILDASLKVFDPVRLEEVVRAVPISRDQSPNRTHKTRLDSGSLRRLHNHPHAIEGGLWLKKGGNCGR